MSFIEQLRDARASILHEGKGDDDGHGDIHTSLKGLRGTTGPDGVERLTTQAIFEVLGLTQGQRTAATARRIAQSMRDLGWTPTRVFGLNQRGTREQVRGYARCGKIGSGYESPHRPEG